MKNHNAINTIFTVKFLLIVSLFTLGCGQDETQNIEASLSKDLIRTTVRNNIDDVKFCYDSLLETQSQLEGKLVFKWVINSDGEVSEIENIEDSVGSSELVACLQSNIKEWTFPKPEGNGSVTVSYPFVFTPPSESQEPVTEKTTPAKNIQTTVNNNIDDVKFCYDSVLETQSQLEGKLVFKWTISPLGKITDNVIIEDTIGSFELIDCLKTKMGEWKFAESLREYVVKYPFVFSPSDK